jgi:hypothetical protein
MYKVDNRAIQGDTTNMLLSNISEQLSEIIMLLKPHKEAEKVIEPTTAKKLYTCKKCGKTSDSKGDLNTPQRLAVHSRFCKGE